MLRLLKRASPEDLFVERYDLLLGWALTLTNHNQPQAEDLVHDAFIQFAHRRGDLAPIENADAYLHRMLRNMYLSEVRRAGVIQDSRFSIADFDSAEMGLRTFRANDPTEHLDLQDQLRQICQYACIRKQTSKAGSVLILRFFHGYYPSEIAQVLRTSRTAVDRWVQISRREAKGYLSDPMSLKFMSDSRTPDASVSSYVRPTTELLSELREIIFAGRDGDCFSSAQLKQRYQGPATIDVVLLSHMVSCPRCLDTVNRLLGLPLLAERSSEERLGRDVPPDKSGGGGTGGSGTSIMESRKKYQRREKEVMEHRPQELRIAVNGFVVGSQQVSSELSKLSLAVNVDEPIGFIEVFSEQAVRLLFFEVDQPTDGGIEQDVGVDFDCGRSLNLSLSFRGPWPAVNLSYLDPTFEAVNSPDDLGAEASPEPVLDESKTQVAARTTLWWEPLARVRSSLRKFDWRMFLRPGFVTALVSVVLITVAVLVYRHVPTAPITAADLLNRAATAEDVMAGRRDQVLHRTISLEEKKLNGELIARRKLEVWQSAEKGITARRLYDEAGKLIGGDWRRADGVQTLYHHGAPPTLQIPNPQSAIRSFNNVWRLSLSAKEFLQIIKETQNSRVEERADSYVVSVESLKSGDNKVVRATLTLNRAGLRPTEQILIVQHGTEQREYRFVETSFEQKALSTVAPAVFQPDPELLSSIKLETPNSKAETEGTSPLALTPSPAVASADLEVEILGLLHQAQADLGEQVTVTRTREGHLRVEALVDTDARKGELLRALESVRSNPAVRIEINTVAEALKRQAAAKSSPELILVEQQGTVRSVAAASELRRYFSSKGVAADRVDGEIARFANRTVNQSLQVMVHAGAIKRVGERFSAEQLHALTPAARMKWLVIVRAHAQSVRQETAALRQQLQSVFASAGAAVGEEPIVIGNDADLLRALERLFEICAANDRMVSSAFAFKVSGPDTSDLRGPQFWRSLRRAEQLAAAIQSRQ